MLSLSTISIGTTMHLPPSSLISLAKDSSLSTLLAEIATSAPQLARTFAKRYPKPEEAPVTNATWPLRSKEKLGLLNEDIFLPFCL